MNGYLPMISYIYLLNNDEIITVIMIRIVIKFCHNIPNTFLKYVKNPYFISRKVFIRL